MLLLHWLFGSSGLLGDCRAKAAQSIAVPQHLLLMCMRVLAAFACIVYFCLYVHESLHVYVYVSVYICGSVTACVVYFVCLGACKCACAYVHACVVFVIVCGSACTGVYVRLCARVLSCSTADVEEVKLSVRLALHGGSRCGFAAAGVTERPLLLPAGSSLGLTVSHL